MQIVAAMSFYDEPLWFLSELVASVARAGAAHIVCVDGAYMMYPSARGSSGSEAAAVIAAAADGAGIGYTIHVPHYQWPGNEVEKRTFLFAAAHLTAEPDEDWIWICDADEVVTDGYSLRRQLEATEFDVAEVILCEKGPAGDEYGKWPIRKLFRAQPAGIRVEDHHARYVTGDGRVLWDAKDHDAQEPADQFMDVRVRHRPEARPAYRNENRAKYYANRGRLAIEG